MEKKMKVVSVNAFTKSEAVKIANLDLTVKNEVTASWKKKGIEMTEENLKAFLEEYVTIKGNKVGVGYIFTIDAGIPDNREKPYIVENVTTDGARKYKMVYQGYTDVETPGEGGILVVTANTKGEAKAEAKKYVTGFKKDVEIRVNKQVVEGQNLAMTVKYTPSKRTKLGTYIVFGYEN